MDIAAETDRELEQLQLRDHGKAGGRRQAVESACGRWCRRDAGAVEEKVEAVFLRVDALEFGLGTCRALGRLV